MNRGLAGVFCALLLAGGAVACASRAVGSPVAQDSGAGAAGGSAAGGSVAGAVDGGIDAGGSGNAVSHEDLVAACQRVAEVWCSRLTGCNPSNLELFYGSEESCRANTLDECQMQLTMEGGSGDPAEPTLLASELEDLACYQINPYVWSLPYGRAGLWPDGTDCRFAFQCQSGWCDMPLSETCGTCRVSPDPEQHVGEPCEVDGAAFGCRVPGLICVVATETCVLPPKPGEPCLPGPTIPDWDRCGFEGLECRDGTCIAPLGYEEPCDQADDRCSQDASLKCSAESLCNRTDHDGPAHVTGECGPFAEPPGTCGYLDACSYTDPNGNNDGPGYCEPAHQLGFGDPCDDTDPAAWCPLSMSCLDGTCQTRRLYATCD